MVASLHTGINTHKTINENFKERDLLMPEKDKIHILKKNVLPHRIQLRCSQHLTGVLKFQAYLP
jgi:hypothetical protein